MTDFQIPPYLYDYLPALAIVLAVFAFVAISRPLAKKPIAGTTLRRQSIVSIIAAVVAMFYSVMSVWEMVLVSVVLITFITFYYRNHLDRKQAAQMVAKEKQATREAQLASFLAEGEEPMN